MTFLEAAIEILREADGALHFTEVARQAVERNLLSHVGRDPEAAMRSCLNSAVRQSRNGDAPLIVRESPGTYGIRPGADLPERKAPPEEASAGEEEAEAEAPKPRRSRARSSKAKAAEAAEAEAEEPKDSSASGRKSKARSRGRDSAADSDDDAGKKRRRRTRSARGEAPAPASIEVIPVRTKRGNGESKRPAKKPRSSALAAKVEARNEAEAAAAAEVRAVEFEAPTGSGLEGVTDVALVMANAMSRIVEERPELKDELDAIQSNAEDEATAAASTPGPTPPAASASRPASAPPEEKSGRRRRRRRRRGKRVDWSTGSESRNDNADLGDALLDGVASVLEESGPRSLHVRQIAESLASKNVLGGEISEIERAVTAAILMDLHLRGRSSRFVARGDARYQLQGTRLPERVAKAEQSVRDAVRVLENETRTQIVHWLQSLGARALESLVRIWLAQEGFLLLSALPPARGLGKLIAMDPEPDEDDGKTLVLVVPRRTALDAKLWEGEAERNGCSQVLVFSMGEGDGDLGGETRVIGVAELSVWLSQQGVAVNDFTVTVKVLDATLIESIAGLDT